MSNDSAVPGDGKAVSPSPLWRFVSQHPAFALSVGCVAVSAFGVFSSWYTFLQFRVSYLDYAGLDDFFLAGLRNPSLTGAGIAFLLGHWVIVHRGGSGSLLDRMLKWPFYGVASACVIGGVLMVHSIRDVNQLLCSEHDVVLVTMRAPVETSRLVVVGTTSQYLLAFNADDRAGRCGSDGETAGSRPPLLTIPRSEIRVAQHVVDSRVGDVSVQSNDRVPPTEERESSRSPA